MRKAYVLPVTPGIYMWLNILFKYIINDKLKVSGINLSIMLNKFELHKHTTK